MTAPFPTPRMTAREHAKCFGWALVVLPFLYAAVIVLAAVGRALLIDN